jgi:hypothetical protein
MYLYIGDIMKKGLLVLLLLVTSNALGLDKKKAQQLTVDGATHTINVCLQYAENEITDEAGRGGTEIVFYMPSCSKVISSVATKLRDKGFAVKQAEFLGLNISW